MHIVYIDDSGDEKSSMFAALIVPFGAWNQCFNAIRDKRRALRRSDGIFTHVEFHATKFVSGRGHIADKRVGIERRAEIFREMLSLVAAMPYVKLLNASFPVGQDERAFERLLNRIQVWLKKKGAYGVVVCDNGKELKYTRLRRKMGVHNFIQSNRGAWESGEAVKNIPLDRIVEDLVFRDSKQSHFVQLADFCAYALLRSERPLPAKTALGLDSAFDLLKPLCIPAANSNDPRGLGIIRP